MMEVSDRQNSFRLSNSSQLVVLAAESKYLFFYRFFFLVIDFFFLNSCKRFEWINSIRDSIREIMAYQERCFLPFSFLPFFLSSFLSFFLSSFLSF